MFVTNRPTLPDFSAFQEQLNSIVECTHRVAQALGEETHTLEHLPGWLDLVDKPRRMVVHQGRICLVCVLFGPSGAGKSTIFKLLTNIQVPSGETRRPMTHNCAVAIPVALRGKVDLEELFPGHQVRLLTDGELLKEKGRPESELYFQYYEENEPESAWLILADVPDFNTVERRNWIRAEKMLGRAETVVFTVYPEAYKDAAVVAQLRECAFKSGNLAYVITKLSPENPAQSAHEIWQDVLDHAYHAPEFQVLRADGRSVTEFLRQAAVYYSVRTAVPALQDIKALDPRTPDFRSLLKGQDAAAVYWANLMEVADQGIASAAGLSRKALELSSDLRKKQSRADQRIIDVSERIAGSQFPAGELVELIISIVKENRPGWLRTVTLPFALGAGAFLSLRKLLSRFRATQREALLKDRHVLERQRLDDAVEVLLEGWRGDYPAEAATGLLQSGKCRHAAELFRQRELPPVRSEWKETMREDVQNWAAKHPWFGSLVGTLSEMLVLFGGAALVLDLTISGGIFGAVGHLGIAGAAGAGSMGAGTVLKMFEELKLKDILEKADAKWRAQRCQELADHLRAHLAGPLFLHDWQEKVRTLDAAHPEQCLLACQRLREQWMNKADQ